MSDPDVILLADAVWSPAGCKRRLLIDDPVLSKLRAVRENRLIDIPFTHVLPNVGSGRAVLELAEQLKNLPATQVLHSNSCDPTRNRETLPGSDCIPPNNASPP